MSVRAEARLAGVAVDAENRQRDDFYPTPPEGTRALLSVERFEGPIWEPACGDGAISRVSHNVAPALSNDGSTVYVVVKWSTNNNYAYLLGLNSTTLATKYKVFLKDPRNGNAASVPEDGTASPMVGGGG
jgi:hypothetical protein